MTSKSMTTLTAAIVAGTVLVACGGDTEPLSKDEFIARADEICAATNERVAPIFEAVWQGLEDVDDTSASGEASVFVRFDQAVDEAMPHFERQLEQLRSLEPPAEDQELIDTLLDDHETALAEGAELIEAAAGGDEAAMAALDSDDPVAEVERRVRAYGMRVCGSDG